MKKVKLVSIIILLITLSACTGKSGVGILSKKDVIYNPITLFFSPVEDYIMRSECIPDFVNYPNDRVRMGLKGNVKTVEYTTTHKMLLSFKEDASMACFSIIFAGSGSDKEGHIYSFNRNDSNRLERMDEEIQLVNSGALYKMGVKTIDKFSEYLPSGKPKVRIVYKLSNKKVDYIKQYQYDENEICRGMILASNSPTQKADYMDCDITSDEDGKVKTIYVQGTRLLVHRLAKGERTITPIYDEDGRLIGTKEKGIPHNMEAYNQDSIVCRNDYQYNDKGDIIGWKYNDIVYPGNATNEVSLTFAYEYDNQGNWIKKHIIGEVMYLDYIMNSNYYGKYKVERISEENNQEKGEIVISRNIVYYESTINKQ